jgi:hypothetical protein
MVGMGVGRWNKGGFFFSAILSGSSNMMSKECQTVHKSIHYEAHRRAISLDVDPVGAGG